MNSRLNAAIIALFFFMIVLGCGNSTSTVTVNDSTPKNTSVPDKPAQRAPKDISGEYTVNGSNPNGSSYKGKLEVIKQDEVYQFKWNTGTVFDGVGVENGGNIAVAFANGTNGKGCSVVIYTIGSDGTLEGKWGEWGVNNSGTEKAVLRSGTSLDGEYDAMGKRLDGREYKASLTVSPQGAGYKFVWDSSGKIEGFGIKLGDTVSVGIGGKQCGFVAYVAGSDGTLDGKWGAPGTTTIGTETATKK